MMFKSIFTLIGAGMFSILVFFYVETIKVKGEEEIYLEGTPINSESPPCLQMYYNIEKYSEKYGIPKNYAYGIAWKETRYSGPFDWDYDHTQTSTVGALGPMQVMPATARSMWNKKISASDLKNDIPFNVETSMKLLKHLHDKYGDWKIVFGAYNTGKPMINQYAIDVYNYRMK